MIAVWSFWSKPYQAERHHFWYSELHHLLAWALSVATAGHHFAELHLCTDDDGARLLVDGLGLPFTRVSTDLNSLAEYDASWWGLGKVHTYRMQTEPFVHLDSDVFLWKPLPAQLEQSDVFTQNSEPCGGHYPFYRPEPIEHALAQVGGWLPEEWRWFRQAGVPQHGECCGLLGGKRVDFIRHYADASFRLMTDPINQRAWGTLTDKPWHMVLAEQYLIAACADYHAAHPGSPFHDIVLQRLFASAEESWDARCLRLTGYTHLLGGAKRNRQLAQRLAERVQSDYPQLYERCVSYAYRHPSPAQDPAAG